MHNSKEWLLEKHSFWFSLLCHLLLLFSFIFVWHPFERFKPEPKPQMYVPSYLAQNTSMPIPMPPSPTRPQPQKQQVENLPTNSEGLLAKSSPTQPLTSSSSTMANSKQVSKNLEGIQLIGDDKKAPKPLIKLLAKDLSSHLIYPKIAVDFRLHGTAYVGFTIHPDGQVTGVKLMQSSKASVLDDAAVSAVTRMSPGPVGKYLPAAKFLVVGIIFG